MTVVKASPRWRLAALTLSVATAAAGSARAGTHVDVGELSADGLTVLELACDLDGEGGLLAGAAIVGALAKQKAAFDACGPKGEAVRASFRWAGTKTQGIEVLAASDPKTGSCVAAVLGQVKAAMGGRCTATLLTGPEEAARKAAAGIATPQDVGSLYADPKAWTTLTMREQGWQLWVVGGAKVNDAALELDGTRWVGAVGEHRHQLLWVFWHPTAPMDAAVVAKLTAEAYRFAPELTWLPVETLPAREGFPRVVIEKAQRPPHRLHRVVADGPGGRHFFLSLFAAGMPDEVVLSWIRSITFLPRP